MNAFKKIMLLVAVYLAAWTVAYSIMMEFDYRYYFEYLYLAWTSPGERPVFIQIISVLVTIFVLVAFFVVNKRKSLRSRESS